jgi:hypothetical protein
MRTKILLHGAFVIVVLVGAARGEMAGEPSWR